MSTRAEIRDDFIRRLFAVAISIGFAATLIEMAWVENGTLPSKGEWEQLAILATGLVATVLSWDGYLASIKSKPLNGYARFAIDILLVFIYMFFLISSKRPEFWLIILAVVFFLYVIWDFLTVREHMGRYNTALLSAGADSGYRAKISDVLRVYSRGFLGRPDTGRGPIITLSWAVYFAVLAELNLGKAEWQVFVMSAFAIAGLILYRWDKVAKPDEASVAGFPMWLRALLITFLLVVAALYFCMFRIGWRT